MRCRILIVVACLILPGPVASPAHEDHPGEAASAVKIDVRDGFRHITANGLPDHETGRFPGRGNPNTIRPQTYAFKVPLKPTPAATHERAGGPTLFGIALNGVVFDPGTAEWWRNDPAAGWNYEALGGTLDLGLDKNNAHVQRNGAYHYHGIPVGLIHDTAKDAKEKPMTLVGWAADGYPIYASSGYAEAKDPKSGLKKLKSSYRLKDGTRPAAPEGPGGKYDGAFTRDYEYVEGSGDLDECNGREGVTPEFPDGTYYYVLTDAFPYVPRQFHGVPDDSFHKRRGPGGPGGLPPGARGLRPPR
jgi:hypothetical protein